MSLFHRILFAGDLSERLRMRLPRGPIARRGIRARLHVLNVVEPVLISSPPGPARRPAAGRAAGVHAGPSQGYRV